MAPRKKKPLNYENDVELTKDDFVVFEEKNNTIPRKPNLYNIKISEFTKKITVEEPDLLPKQRLKKAQEMYKEWKSRL